MARVTVEDCMDKVKNRFDLILIASKRAHQLNSGTHKAYIPYNGDKAGVVALREIAEGYIDDSILEDTYDILPTVGISMSEVESELSEIVATEDELKESSEIIETK